jgi:hypothetical protein
MRNSCYDKSSLVCQDLREKAHNDNALQGCLHPTTDKRT